MKQHLLLGTAGHIDHGKTTLVQALTGVNTDRLPDEKRRQITIDLGFAPLDLDDYSLGIVDVPGHERFVKNMLAGAAGVDLAMLVIAANDSVKPQTREHLDILKHLGLSVGLIVITKCDLAEPDWIELVEAEVRELVADTFLSAAPIIRVSATTGQGIDDLRTALAGAAEIAFPLRDQAQHASAFCMAIDRAFTVAGHGTVVTGSVASGKVSVGDTLELQPLGLPVRVRGLQSHDTSVEQVARGQRAAINLAGVHYDEVTRGQVLATPNTLQTSRRLTVELQLSDQLARPLKNHSAIRLHLGAASIPGKITLLGPADESETDSPLETQTADTGAKVYAQIFLSQAVAAVWGQPFVIRSISPVDTLGGGRVLDPVASKIKRSELAKIGCLSNLATDDVLQRAMTIILLRGSLGVRPDELATLVRANDADSLCEQLLQDNVVIPFPQSNDQTTYLHQDVVTQLIERITRALSEEHAKMPLRNVVERSRITRHFRRIDSHVFDGLCNRLQEKNLATVKKHGLTLVGWKPQLTATQQEVLKQIVAAYRAAQLQAPTLDQLASELQQLVVDVTELAEVAVEAGALVRISKEILLDCHAEQQARTLVTQDLVNGQGLSVSQIRELLGTTRKIAVPYCEYLDALGVTRRDGDLRRLATNPTKLTT